MDEEEFLLAGGERARDDKDERLPTVDSSGVCPEHVRTHIRRDVYMHTWHVYVYIE